MYIYILNLNILNYFVIVTDNEKDDRMSYEAVPCMVRAPSQDGTKGTILGVIIRPSSSQVTILLLLII